jgi:2-dehydro-3-deoxyphosphogluconate aldolase/(4S)-4-hydroxy-2-oxoglutarate aldolase
MQKKWHTLDTRCATLTEIVTAKEAGATVIKIFPGLVLGPGFVSSVLAVVPGLKLMPTGGVEPTEQNLSAWFDAGVISGTATTPYWKKRLALQ